MTDAENPCVICTQPYLLNSCDLYSLSQEFSCSYSIFQSFCVVTTQLRALVAKTPNKSFMGRQCRLDIAAQNLHSCCSLFRLVVVSRYIATSGQKSEHSLYQGTVLEGTRQRFGHFVMYVEALTKELRKYFYHATTPLTNTGLGIMINSITLGSNSFLLNVATSLGC